MSKRVLYLVPHLSTGGLPQYLLKKVLELKDECDITVVEWDNITGGVLVVQRSQLQELLGTKLITVNKNGDELVDIVASGSWDVVHLEEIPEMWLPHDVAIKIYNNTNRRYKIVETSHDSSFDVKNKYFLPDKFIFVSQYQVNKFIKLGVPCEVIEYPIEEKQREFPITHYQSILKMDTTKKHIINVGLFTSRKNQSEIIEYARKMQDQPVHFHFVGNLAENFRYYWEPIVESLPSNVTVWGERSDVDNFYKAADLFLFTSRGTDGDKETMPLVIREALSWNLPILIYNLPVYLNYFNKYKNVSYLSFNDLNGNISAILDKLGLPNSYNLANTPQKEAIIISTYPNHSAAEQLTEACIEKARTAGLPIILTSHYPVSQKLQKMVDYVVYDSNNILTKHTFYSKSWYEQPEYYAEINIRKEGNDSYHGPAVYTNYYNGINLAHDLGFEVTYCMNFDMVLDKAVFDKFRILKGGKNGVFNLNKASEGNTLRTVFHVIDTETFKAYFSKIQNEEDYNTWYQKVQAESNGLENIYYHQLRHAINNNYFNLLSDEEFYQQFEGYNIDTCSQIEYQTVLPVKNQDDKLCLWFSTANKEDHRYVHVYVNDQIINKLHIHQILQWYHIIDYNTSVKIKFVIMNHLGEHISTKEIFVDKLRYNLNENGFIQLK